MIDIVDIIGDFVDGDEFESYVFTTCSDDDGDMLRMCLDKFMEVKVEKRTSRGKVVRLGKGRWKLKRNILMERK